MGSERQSFYFSVVKQDLSQRVFVLLRVRIENHVLMGRRADQVLLLVGEGVD